MRALFDYLCGKDPNSELTNAIAESIAKAKKDRRWERDYVQFIEKLKEAKMAGREEGREESAAIISFLLSQKRYDDLEKVSTDVDYYQTILAEMQAAGILGVADGDDEAATAAKLCGRTDEDHE